MMEEVQPEAAAAAGAGKSGSGQKRGRPKMDRSETTDTILEELRSADRSSSQWFGNGKHVHVRTLARLYDDLQQQAKTIGDVTLWTIVNKRARRVRACAEVLNIANSKGLEHPTFGDTMTAQINFLNMDPKVSHDLPDFIMQAWHIQKTVRCVEPSDFWRMLPKPALSEAGATDIDMVREKILSMRLVAICRVSTKSVGSLLATLLEYQPRWQSIGLTAACEDTLTSLRNLASSDTHSLDEVQEALRKAATLPLLNVVKEFPRGTTLFDAENL